MLARRMSPISLSSLDEQQNTNYSENTLRQKQPLTSSSSSGTQRLQAPSQPPSDRKMSTAVGSRINATTSSKPSSKTEFKRARYSSPYASDLPNGKGLPENSAAKSIDPGRYPVNLPSTTYYRELDHHDANEPEPDFLAFDE